MSLTSNNRIRRQSRRESGPRCAKMQIPRQQIARDESAEKAHVMLVTQPNRMELIDYPRQASLERADHVQDVGRIYPYLGSVPSKEGLEREYGKH